MKPETKEIIAINATIAGAVIMNMSYIGSQPNAKRTRRAGELTPVALSCGCVKGARLCMEAQELHEKRDQLWRELQNVPIDDHRWAPYDEITELLDIHMGNEPVGRTR